MDFDLTVFLAVLAVLAVAVAVVSAPLRRPPASDDEPGADEAALAAARDAKYREIREADLDLRTGKLSRADWEAIDSRLRAEAVEILYRLGDGEKSPPAPGGSPGGVR